MWQGIAANTAGNLLGGILGGQGQAAGTRAAGRQIQQGMAENTAMSEQQRQQQASLQQPWLQGGQQGFQDLQNFRMREPGSFAVQQFGGVNMGEDPGVQYRMDQGRRALDQSASRRGALFSGAQQKALQEQGQNLASQEFQNAYGRQYGQFKDFQDASRGQSNIEADRTMNLDQYRMNQLQGIAGMGQTATGQLGSAYQNIGGNELTNQLQMRGAMADVKAAQAAQPWNTAAGAISTIGAGAGNALSYFGRK